MAKITIDNSFEIESSPLLQSYTDRVGFVLNNFVQINPAYPNSQFRDENSIGKYIAISHKTKNLNTSSGMNLSINIAADMKSNTSQTSSTAQIGMIYMVEINGTIYIKCDLSVDNPNGTPAQITSGNIINYNLCTKTITDYHNWSKTPLELDNSKIITPLVDPSISFNTLNMTLINLENLFKYIRSYIENKIKEVEISTNTNINISNISFKDINFYPIANPDHTLFFISPYFYSEIIVLEEGSENPIRNILNLSNGSLINIDIECNSDEFLSTPNLFLINPNSNRFSINNNSYISEFDPFAYDGIEIPTNSSLVNTKHYILKFRLDLSRNGITQFLGKNSGIGTDLSGWYSDITSAEQSLTLNISKSISNLQKFIQKIIDSIYNVSKTTVEKLECQNIPNIINRLLYPRESKNVDNLSKFPIEEYYEIGNGTPKTGFSIPSMEYANVIINNETLKSENILSGKNILGIEGSAVKCISAKNSDELNSKYANEPNGTIAIIEP